MLSFPRHYLNAGLAVMSRRRKENFSEAALAVLIDSVVGHYENLYGALRDSTSLGLKNTIWKGICRKVNDVDNAQRSVRDLKKRWHDFTRRLRQKLAESYSTGQDARLTKLQTKVYAVTRASSINGTDGTQCLQSPTDSPLKVEVKSEDEETSFNSPPDEDHSRLSSVIPLEMRPIISVQPAVRQLLPPAVVTSETLFTPCRTRSQTSTQLHSQNSQAYIDSSSANPTHVVPLHFTPVFHPPPSNVTPARPATLTEESRCHQPETLLHIPGKEKEHEEEHMAAQDLGKPISTHQEYSCSLQAQLLRATMRQAAALERQAVAQERQAAAAERAAHAHERAAAAQECVAVAQEQTLVAVGELVQTVRLTHAEVKHISLHLGKANQITSHHTDVLEGLQGTMTAQGITAKKQGTVARRFSVMAQNMMATTERHMATTSQSLQTLSNIMERQEQTHKALAIHIGSENSTTNTIPIQASSPSVSPTWQVQHKPRANRPQQPKQGNDEPSASKRSRQA